MRRATATTAALLALAVLFCVTDSNAYTRIRPVRCGANADLKIDGKLIATPDVGILVVGNCDITVVNSKIVGGKIAIHVTGNGDVKIRNSIIEGRRFAVLIYGSGDVYDKGGNTFKGPIRVRGSGTFHASPRSRRLGMSRPLGPPADRPVPIPTASAGPPMGPPRGLKRAAPANCTGVGSVVLRNRWIQTRGVAVTATGMCSVRLVNCWIAAGRVGILSTGTKLQPAPGTH